MNLQLIADEAMEEIQLEPWLKSNGRELRFQSNESWVCLYVPGRGELRIAKMLFQWDIPFFVPVGYDLSRKAFAPIWCNYVFCRVNSENLSLVKSRIQPLRILQTAFQKELREELAQTPPFSNIKKIYQPILGEKVQVIEGPLWGQYAYVSKPDLIEGGKIEVSLELLGRWNRLHLPVTAVDHINARPEIFPLTFKLEERAAEKPLDLELAEVNRELIAYLNHHPELLYSLPPRKFELLVADILKAMGYDVTVTPQTRDGGADILAVFKSPIGPVMTIVECKRYEKERKIGVDIVERFLYTIREKFRASCGLIATTSFFSQDSLRIQRDFHWQLVFKDFNDIKGWLSNYGSWVEDGESGLWLPRGVERKD